jgi:hypothetical protein
VTSVRLARSAFAALAASATACDSHILVGADPADGACPDDAGLGDAMATLVVPWQTGFENGFNDYGVPPDCYVQQPGSSYSIVSAPLPIHSGLHAAAFTVDSSMSTALLGSATRCKKNGVFPTTAYYGAWYYVPAPATNTGNWNLLHFRGSNTPNGATHGLWDVSLVNTADGGAIDTAVFDFLRTQQTDTGAPIPINRWFHLVVFFRRACGPTGQFTLFQDDALVFDKAGIATDDSVLGGWHVGNLATALSPAVSTVYVDDVTISATGP